MLREAEQLSNSLVETSQAIIIILDLEGRVVRFNPYATQSLGWSYDSVVGRNWFTTFIPKPHRKDIRKRFRLSLDGPPARGHVNPVLTKDGQIRHVSWYDRVLSDGAGNRRGLLAIGHDVTDQLEAEVKRRRDRQLLDASFTQALIGLLWVGPSGEVLRVNDAYLELVGCGHDGCVGHSISQFHADPGAAERLLEQLACGKSLQHLRQRLRCTDGSIRHVVIDANGLWEKQRLLHSSWFVRDITHMVELERQILSISEREQRRLGRDLHDDLCQRLATTEYLCHALQRELVRHRRPEAKRAREIGKLLQETTSHARGVAAGLATVELQEQGLRGALKHLLRRTRRAFGISCTLRADGFQGTDLQHELHLYRIAQEAVSNALRHGRARRIHVRLATTRAGITLRDTRRYGEAKRNGHSDHAAPSRVDGRHVEC
jgi:PAS domain S-box-containing protein